MKEWNLKEAENFIYNILVDETDENELTDERCRVLARLIAQSLEEDA